MATQQKRTLANVDWSKYLSLAWAILLVTGTLLYHAGGRLESPEEKVDRVRRIVQPIKERVDHVEKEFHNHERREGHATLVERVKAIELRIKMLENK